MAVSTVSPLSSMLHSHFGSASVVKLCRLSKSNFSVPSLSPLGKVRLKSEKKRRARRLVLALSTHSAPRIVKSNRKSQFEDEVIDFYEDEDGDDGFDLFDDDEFAEVTYYDVKSQDKLNKVINLRQDTHKGLQKLQESNPSNSRAGPLSRNDKNAGRNVKKKTVSNAKGSGLHDFSGSGKIPSRTGRSRYPRLCEAIQMDERWVPLLDYLTKFGLKESHFLQMYERHKPSLQINVCSAEQRLDYLFSIGVKQRDVKRILLRQPQILEYTVDNNLKAHVAFLMRLGIPNSKIGQIIASTPSLFSYSVDNSLKPTVRYLVEEVGIKERDLGKVIQLSPQILVQRIDISWNTRYIFLSEELGAPRDSIVKMVKKHPQLLHYSIDDGLLPRINFFRSIGMCNSDILKILTSLTQVLSLSLEDNLKPKYQYLINELRNETCSLTKYPTYLSLSLDKRIRPRHRFLVALKKAPNGPFPLSSFVPTDESFCQQWAGTSLDKYLAFRQSLQLNDSQKNKCLY